MYLQSKNRKLKLILLLLLSVVTVNSKIIAQASTPIQSFRITAMSHKDSISQFLKTVNSTEIDFNSNKESKYPFRIKTNDCWALVSEVWNDDENQTNEEGLPLQNFYGYQFYGKKEYSFLFPENEDHEITIAEKENKKYVVSLQTFNVDKFWFDEIQNFYRKLIIQTYNNKTKTIYYNESGISEEVYFCSKIKRGEDWALGLIYEGRILQLSSFSHKENFLFETILQGDKILDYPYNSDFEVERVNIDCAQKINKLFKDIPHLNKVVAKEQIFQVWKNNLVGFYNSDLSKNQPIEFEDIEVVNLDYMNAVALKKNGLWSLYRLEEATLLFDSQAETTKELLILWLNR